MKLAKVAVLTLASGSLAWMPGALHAEIERDCVLEGTVRKNNSDQDKVYVAFHSYRPAEEGARCNIRKREKLQFKQPAASDIKSAAPGSKVEYRYTEDSKDGARWQLRNVGKSS
jgi:hypothetical protein